MAAASDANEGLDHLERLPRRLFTLYLPLGVFLFVLLFPFYWMTTTTFKPDDELYDYAANDPQWYIRYAAISALYDIRESWNQNAEAIGQTLSSLNSGDASYNALKQQLQQRKDAMNEIERRIGEMKKHETNDMLKAIMND